MKKSILFVDDDPLLLEVYPFMLDEVADRWEVSSAEGGAKALELLASKKFDVVVSDMRMPKMNGIELMNEVRRLHPETSRIIISGLGDQEEIARSLETTHQFLSKPVRAKELVASENWTRSSWTRSLRRSPEGSVPCPASPQFTCRSAGN